MTVAIQYSTVPFGGFTTVNVGAARIDKLKIALAEQGIWQASWTMYVPQHQVPIPRLAFVRIWDQGAVDSNGNAQSAVNPLYEGYIENVTPGDDGHTVEYLAADARKRVANQVTVMSTAWAAGSPISGSYGSFPAPGTGAVPRLVCNVKIDNDQDYAFARLNDATVGEIIQTLLEDQYQPLYWLNAANASGTAYRLNAGSGTGAGSEIAGMDFKPQGKVSFESESIGSAIQRLMGMYAPNYRCYLEPGQRMWRFYDAKQSPAITIPLNTVGSAYIPLSLDLTPSMEERYTSIEIRGPETTVVAAPGGEGDVGVFETDGSAPTLSPVGSGILLQNYSTAGGMHEARSYTQYQIVDSTKRRGAKRLSRTVTVPMVSPHPDGESFGYEYMQCHSPTLQISFDDGSTWMTVLGVDFDFQNGIATMSNPIYYYTSPAPIAGSTQTFFPPTNVRLVWAYFSDPITVRKPASGHEGTALTVAGLRNTLHMYDSQLAVGYEYGTPVTTATRTAQFEKLAQALLDERKDIVWTGGVTLDGLVYGFSRLNKRVNFSATDNDGVTVTTGWEAINAHVTEVEYDFTEQLTTLTFSSDQMSLMGVDIDRLKERLKIKALEQREVITSFIQYGNPYGFQALSLAAMDVSAMGGGFAQSTGSIIGTTTQYGYEYVDPETGEQG